VKSVNRGNARADVLAGDSGVTSAMTGDGESVPAGGESAGGRDPARVPLRQLMDDRLLDALLERSRDEAGGLRLTGEGSMLGELVKAVPARARTG
jgi:putative transposase